MFGINGSHSHFTEPHFSNHIPNPHVAQVVATVLSPKMKTKVYISSQGLESLHIPEYPYEHTAIVIDVVLTLGPSLIPKAGSKLFINPFDYTHLHPFASWAVPVNYLILLVVGKT